MIWAPAPSAARFVITVHRAVEPEAGFDTEQTALGMTARINQLFARWIAAAPDQWCCAKRRWPWPRGQGLAKIQTKTKANRDAGDTSKQPISLASWL
jgi:lauroyl/myristoyl acyltransferase